MRIDDIIYKIKNYGVRRLSKETGISQHTIYGWTNKDRTPSKRIMTRVAKYFGIEVD